MRDFGLRVVTFHKRVPVRFTVSDRSEEFSSSIVMIVWYNGFKTGYNCMKSQRAGGDKVNGFGILDIWE
jgi:hypothetical protein